MAGVSLQELRKSYDGKTDVLAGIDLEIAHGEFVVLVGPSGCGKSTLLRMLCGLENITSGTMKIGDRVVNQLPPAERGIAMVFQSYALYPHMTVYQNMAFGLKVAGKDKAAIKQRIGEAAAILKIDHLLQRLPRELSGGQRQRVAIGRPSCENRSCSCLMNRCPTWMPHCACKRAGDRQAASSAGCHHCLRHARPGGSHDLGRQDRRHA
jgi:multiple sugar transport system ATP-binding protein